MLTKELQKKQDDLEAYLKELGSVMLAFSGGVDSTYLSLIHIFSLAIFWSSGLLVSFVYFFNASASCLCFCIFCMVLQCTESMAEMAEMDV